MVSEMRFQCSLFLAKLQTVWVSLPLMVRPWKASELCGENDLNRGQTKKLKTFFVPSESDPTWCDVREIRTLVMSGKDPQCCDVRDSPCFDVRERSTMMWRQRDPPGGMACCGVRDPPRCDVRERSAVVTSEIRHVLSSEKDSPCDVRVRSAMLWRQREIRKVVTSEIRHVLSSEKDSPCDVRVRSAMLWRQGEIRKVVTLERFAMFCRQKKIHHVVTSE